MKEDKWLVKWDVPSSDRRRSYTVSMDGNGNYACSCIGWTRHYPRIDCKHILEIKSKVLKNE